MLSEGMLASFLFATTSLVLSQTCFTTKQCTVALEQQILGQQLKQSLILKLWVKLCVLWFCFYIIEILL